MKLGNLILGWSLVVMLLPTAVRANDITVVVSNDEPIQRQELAEVNINDVYNRMGIAKGESIIVKNALGQEVPYQITYDGKLLIDAAVRPCGQAVYTISAGKPQAMKTFVTGKMYPERVDDIAWENDRTAYRLYGPALQRSGEKAYGIDVWVKNTPDLEVDNRYKVELGNHAKIQQLLKEGKKEEARQMEIATTYHFDHGYGLDCYKVGPTLGCGTPALMENGLLVMPYSYRTYKILDNGPLRFTVELEYNPTTANGNKNVIEHRLLSLDKGSNFNKMTVWYEGITKPTDIAAGVVVHEEDMQSYKCGRDFVAYADPTDNPAAQNFQIYVAALFPNGVSETKPLLYDAPRNGAAGHVVGILRDYKNAERYTYYFGSAWSKNDVRNFDEWILRINSFLDAVHSPLTTTIK
ncbi:MAG: DUF4861 domain-containing protein [Prevotella sp.]|nr:DUF4861 domain-containing protein [Prevotella sp.]